MDSTPPVPGSVDDSEGRPVLVVDGLAKSFGQTQALDDCSFTVCAGEVHAIVGENGSGKSTLVKILAGVHPPDRGRLEVRGRACRGFRSPRQALESGVVAVFQEVLDIGPQTVLENVWLGVDRLLRRRVPEKTKRERARVVLEQLLDEVPLLDEPVELLPLSLRQACVVARALVRDPDVLILDESTSALDLASRDRLLAIVRERTAEGRSVIFISHRMDEINSIAQRITVMRSGRSVATVNRGEPSGAELVRLMTGSERLTAAEGRPPVETARSQDGGTHTDGIVLEARQVRLRAQAGPIDFALRAGEIVGLAGLDGHGQDAFLRALGTGATDGEVGRVDGATRTVIHSRAHAADLGVVSVPRERRAESLFPGLSIRENFAAATLIADRRLGLLSRSRADGRFDPYRSRLAITLASLGLPITTLSGGNQQKVVMARWLAVNPTVLLLNDPTRGVDLNAKRDLYALLRELASEGVAVVMLSTEVDELVELMDRVLVFRESEAFVELDRNALTKEELVASFFGQRKQHDA